MKNDCKSLLHLQAFRVNPAMKTATVDAEFSGFPGRREWTRTIDPHHVKVVL